MIEHDSENYHRELTFFSRAWRKMEKDGHCDGYGGAAYYRVYKEWVAAGKPVDVWSFIQVRANTNSEGK